MELYMIRHGIAAAPAAYAHDSDRPLTPEGERKTAKVAKQLHKMQIHFDLILTSPLLRAQQTAKILQAAGLSAKIEESAHLAPAGDIKEWLKWLELKKEEGCKSLALVGHQPNLGDWAETLLWGKATGSLVVKKAGIIGLTLPELGSPLARSQLFWLTSPKLLIFDS